MVFLVIPFSLISAQELKHPKRCLYYGIYTLTGFSTIGDKMYNISDPRVVFVEIYKRTIYVNGEKCKYVGTNKYSERCYRRGYFTYRINADFDIQIDDKFTSRGGVVSTRHMVKGDCLERYKIRMK